MAKRVAGERLKDGVLPTLEKELWVLPTLEKELWQSHDDVVRQAKAVLPTLEKELWQSFGG